MSLILGKHFYFLIYYTQTFPHLAPTRSTLVAVAWLTEDPAGDGEVDISKLEQNNRVRHLAPSQLSRNSLSHTVLMFGKGSTVVIFAHSNLILKMTFGH